MIYELNEFELDIFESYCPIIKTEAVRIFRTEDDQFIAELRDGTATSYDLVLGTSRSAISLEIMMRPKIVNNEADFRKYLSRKIYRTMRKRNLIQIDISDMTGLSNATITKYINGTATPSAYNLLKIANALRCSVEYLLTFDC